MATVASVGSPQCDRGFILDALLAMNEVPVCKLDKGDVFISLVDPRCISETMEVIQCICKEILSTLDVSAREASLFDRVLRRAIPMVHLGDVDFTSFLRICSTILQAIRVNRAWDPQAQDELIDVFHNFLCQYFQVDILRLVPFELANCMVLESWLNHREDLEILRRLVNHLESFDISTRPMMDVYSRRLEETPQVHLPIFQDRVKFSQPQGQSTGVYMLVDESGAPDVVITPGKSPGTSTLAVKIADSYHKFREITVVSIKDVSRLIEAYSPRNWYTLGQGDSIVFLDKEQICLATRNISNPVVRILVEEAVYGLFDDLSNELVVVKKPRSEFFELSTFEPSVSMEPSERVKEEGLLGELKKKLLERSKNQEEASLEDAAEYTREILDKVARGRLKITSMQLSETGLTPVVKMRIGEGCVKTVHRTAPLWRSFLKGPLVSVATAKSRLMGEKGAGARRESEKIIREEVALVRGLECLGIRNIVPMRMISRGDGRVGIEMPIFEHGDIQSLVTRVVQLQGNVDNIRNKLLSLAYQIGETLSDLHRTERVHSDVKGSNIFVKGLLGEPGELKAFLADFGLACRIGTKRAIAGTYPPPEFLEAYEGDTPFVMTPSVDAWAFGVFLIFVTNQWKNIERRMSWTVGFGRVVEEREKVLASLPQNNPVNEAIHGLLDLNPETRLSVVGALEFLWREGVRPLGRS